MPKFENLTLSENGVDHTFRPVGLENGVASWAFDPVDQNTELVSVGVRNRSGNQTVMKSSAVVHVPLVCTDTTDCTLPVSRGYITLRADLTASFDSTDDERAKALTRLSDMLRDPKVTEAMIYGRRFY